MADPPDGLGERSYPAPGRAGQEAIAAAGRHLAGRLREVGIVHALRGVSGPGRVVAEAAELDRLARAWPPDERALLDLACLGRPVPAAVAREVLGPPAYDALAEIGVLVVDDEVARWPEHALYATPFGWLVGDRPVGFPGVRPRPARAFVDDESLLLAECVARAAPVAAALDVGCGAGLTTLAAARSAAFVVGLDVQPEAVGAARLAVALGALGERVEIREGDLLAPLAASERFDRLLAVLPALPLPAGARAPAHAGGLGGSALSAEVLRQAPHVLRDGGEAWLGAAVLLSGDRLVSTPLLQALADSGAAVSWARGEALSVDEAAGALGRMLAGGQGPSPATAEGDDPWCDAVRRSFREAGADAFAPAIFRVCWTGRAETVALPADPVQWLR